jgi:hypothetical protein
MAVRAFGGRNVVKRGSGRVIDIRGRCESSVVRRRFDGRGVAR